MGTTVSHFYTYFIGGTRAEVERLHRFEIERDRDFDRWQAARNDRRQTTRNEAQNEKKDREIGFGSPHRREAALEGPSAVHNEPTVAIEQPSVSQLARSRPQMSAVLGMQGLPSSTSSTDAGCVSAKLPPANAMSSEHRKVDSQETESTRLGRLGLSSSVLPPGSAGSNRRLQSEGEALFHSAIVPKMWLSELKKISQQVESKRRKGGVTAPVRVAILDTGLDRDFPVFRERSGMLKSVTDVKDFVTPSTSTATDIFGHGTFMARLIMECAPGVEILVARVAKNTDELKNSQANVKEAILWAGQVGKADIISMSFGFASDDQGIREAIETVQKERTGNIIFLASAGNSPTDDESFPARHSSVISVYATNRYGTFLESNSASTSNGAAVLGTYGDDIPDSIREEFRTTYPTVCEPGSSVATAIMAGISATMLGYASVLPSLVTFEGVTVFQHLWTTKGMEAVLYRLAPEDRDRPRLRAVKPMWFWKNKPNDTLRYFAICDALSDIDRRFSRLKGTG